MCMYLVIRYRDHSYLVMRSLLHYIVVLYCIKIQGVFLSVWFQKINVLIYFYRPFLRLSKRPQIYHFFLGFLFASCLHRALITSGINSGTVLSSAVLFSSGTTIFEEHNSSLGNSSTFAILSVYKLISGFHFLMKIICWLFRINCRCFFLTTFIVVCSGTLMFPFLSSCLCILLISLFISVLCFVSFRFNSTPSLHKTEC